MRFEELFTKQDRRHIEHIFGILRTGRHAHERLIAVFHRRIGDAQMSLADRVVVGFHNVMRA